ncbi:Las1-like protein, partial [Tribonema minus]
MIGQASGPRLLPWQNWDEWVHVRGLLWSPDPVDRNEGVLRVAAWRCRERVPHAVECTAQLVEVALHEWRCSTYPGQYGRNSLQLRLMYSSVIVRTVNGLVEAHQKCAHAISIQQIARQIGIPSWLVDLRHDAAHKDMPSLASFRLASAFLLDYLSQRYWDVQQQNL